MAEKGFVFIREKGDGTSFHVKKCGKIPEVALFRVVIWFVLGLLAQPVQIFTLASSNGYITINISNVKRLSQENIMSRMEFENFQRLFHF